MPYGLSFSGTLSHKVKHKEGRCVDVGGKCLNRRSGNAVRLVLVLANQKEHFISFSLAVSQWKNLHLSPGLEREGALVIHFYPDTNCKDVVYVNM